MINSFGLLHFWSQVPDNFGTIIVFILILRKKLYYSGLTTSNCFVPHLVSRRCYTQPACSFFLCHWLMFDNKPRCDFKDGFTDNSYQCYLSGRPQSQTKPSRMCTMLTDASTQAKEETYRWTDTAYLTSSVFGQRKSSLQADTCNTSAPSVDRCGKKHWGKLNVMWTLILKTLRTTAFT